MATSSPSSSGLQSSGSEEDLQQRKRKRMISNRESARRSRMRKQKQLDDLTAQMGQLRKNNAQIVTYMNITTHHYLNVEAENSILRAQVAELEHRLQSLNEIVGFLSSNNGGGFAAFGNEDQHPPHDLANYGFAPNELLGDGFLLGVQPSLEFPLC